MSKTKYPCPSCGCRLYKEFGPCAGEDAPSEANSEWNAAIDSAAAACEDQVLWNMDDPGETAVRIIRKLKRSTETLHSGDVER